MKNIIFIFFCILFLFNIDQASAKSDIARSSARLTMINHVPIDNRIEVLRSFLESHDSPMAPYASTFIQEADKNKLDWKLVAAISGNESQFGHLIPPYSYNGWGYGVYGNNVRRFDSWNDGISIVSKAIRDDYYDKWGATNVYEIGDIYAEDPMWANKVTHYISQIENFEAENSSISISL